LKIKQTPIDELIPYASNSRTHSGEQVAQIAASIKEFGFNNPVLLDKENGIIAGHGRVLAARKLGLKEVPTIELSHLTDTQRKAYVIADNKLALNAGWDMELLSLEMGDLRDEGFDLSLIGFNDDELANMFVDKTEGLTDPDEVPDIPDDPVTVEGDVWLLGKHRIMCGDSTSIDAVDKLMDGQKADMVFTDPPYGVSYQSNRRPKTERFDVLENDDKFLDIAPIIEACSTGWVFVWTSWKVQNKWIEMFDGFGYPTNMVIWHKPGGGIGDLKKTFISDYEIALVWHRGAPLCGKRIGSVWKVAKDAAASYMHPTQKPVELGTEAMDKTTKPGAKVLELFSGSGSTIIAGEMTGRSIYAMELSPAYVDVAVKRWQDFTGEQAKLEGSGQIFPTIKADAA
jgi:DNA modification methylase